MPSVVLTQDQSPLSEPHSGPSYSKNQCDRFGVSEVCCIDMRCITASSELSLLFWLTYSLNARGTAEFCPVSLPCLETDRVRCDYSTHECGRKRALTPLPSFPPSSALGSSAISLVKQTACRTARSSRLARSRTNLLRTHSC